MTPAEAVAALDAIIKGPGAFIVRYPEPRVTSHYTFREDGTLWDNINDCEVKKQ